jgi:hypothetical protein
LPDVNVDGIRSSRRKTTPRGHLRVAFLRIVMVSLNVHFMDPSINVATAIGLSYPRPKTRRDISDIY